MLVRNLFRPIRVINRTTSQPIWTPTCEDIGHIDKKYPHFPPLKRKSPMFKENLELVQGKSRTCSRKIWNLFKENLDLVQGKSGILFKQNLDLVQGKSGICSRKIWSSIQTKS
eukprot:UN00420